MPSKPEIDADPRDQVGTRSLVERTDFPHLLNALRSRGYRVIGPTLRDQAIVYDELDSEAELPIGWTDEQAPGRYRLSKRSDQALFGYNVGPHSWKRFLHPPLVRLWQGRKGEDGFQITPEPQDAPRYAFLGVRSCELHAIAIQDRVFLGGPYTDPGYGQRRSNICVVAVNCGEAGATCFCTSMGTGPQAYMGFDLALTEVLDANRHYFVVEVGTPLGAEILADVPHTEASDEETRAAERKVAQAAAQMGRTLDTTNIRDLLMTNLEHPRWEDVAKRCLACSNCTMVCPTCFCTTVEDVTDLAGEQAERVRRWDSCFTGDFTYIYGGSIRNSTKSRYRQWMTHKLATWIDQFGTSGCVGCGRCITWCPVGIDITEEVRAIRESEQTPEKEA
jgi:ferredoxin